MQHAKTPIKNLLISLVTMVFLLVFLELILRAFFPQILEQNLLFHPDENLGWKFIPNQEARIVHPPDINHMVKIGRLGFRDNEVGNNKKHSVAVLGDSFVSNLSVRDDMVFTERLESKFSNTRFENYGVNGYSTLQEFLLLKKLLRSDHKPDLILHVTYLRNDFLENQSESWFLPRPTVALGNDDQIEVIQPDLSGLEKYKSSGKKPFKSHLWAFTMSRIKNVFPFLFQDKPIEAEVYYCNELIEPEFVKQFRILKILLGKLEQLAEDANIPIVFVLAPSMIQVKKELWTNFIDRYPEHKPNLRQDISNEKLMEFAAQNGLTMIDLLPDLTAYQSGTEELLYHSYEQHWTAKGNEVVSNILFAHLVNEYGLE